MSLEVWLQAPKMVLANLFQSLCHLSIFLAEYDVFFFYFHHRRKPRCSALLALCVFLLCERHRGETSDWFSYINVLPKSYTCPVYFTDDVMAVLPASLQRQAFVQRETLQELYSSSHDIFR